MEFSRSMKWCQDTKIGMKKLQCEYKAISLKIWEEHTTGMG